MKILVVTPEVPYPLNNGGRLRVYHLVRCLVYSGHDVTVITYGSGPSSLKCDWFGSDRAFRLVQVPKPSRLVRIFSFLRALGSGVPYRFAFYSTGAMRKAVRRLLNNGQDLCLVEYLAMVCNVSFRGRCQYVIDTHNVEYRRAEQAFSRKPSLLARLYVAHVKRYEARKLNIADCVLACSETDAGYFKSLTTRAPIHVVPNGVDVQFYGTRYKTESTHKTVLFVGSLDYRPNIEGLQWFINEIWPKVMSHYPEAEFHIVGRSPKEEVTMWNMRSGVKIYADVPDVREYLQTASIVVVPLKSGSGTRLKILEAMASRKPIISTTIGAEGINCTHGKNIVLADNSDAFVEAILRLFADAEYRSRIAEEAWRLVSKEYDWRSVGEELDRCVREIVRARPKSESR
ncbi:glycosyltransferase family 4 protein [Alicyclobacillus pomorum]|uniref:glycosyltransferase family 4 protein n=1 Tax=Alicyclobacillus pomorum TaxID=204470 RepID=UPI000426E71C|nr:glycosyltransferase family 4 protein [Alicyclobacillus pomorum]